MPIRSRRHLIILGVSPLLLALAACSNPLTERPSDRGAHVGLDRLREIQPLSIERFKSDAAPAPTTATGAAGELLQRPASRFEGLEKVELSLEQCRAEALRNNLDLKVALVDPLIAGESLAAERAKFEAVFQPFMRFRNDDRPTLQTTSANQQEALSAGLGVDIPLRTGGRVSVDYTTSRVESPQAIFTASQLYSSDGTVSLSQPLLRNAGREVNVASIQIAGYNQQIAEARTKLSVMGQIAAADRAYWRLYAARKELEVGQSQYESAAKQLTRAENRVKQGDAPDLEVVRAQSDVADRLQFIITAENNVLAAQRELKRVMNMDGLDVETRQTLEPKTDPSPQRYELNEDAMLTLARESRMELLETELQILSDAVSEGFQRNQIMPLLNLDASYTWSGLGSNFNDNNSEITSGRFQSYSIGISGEVPLGNEAAEARLRRATLQRIQRVSSKEARAQAIRQEVLDAIDRVRAGWQKILAARQAVILADRTYQGELRQYDQGASTSIDVGDQLARLGNAQLSEIRALTDYQIAQTDLAVATGTTLGAGRVSWAPEAPAQK